MGMVAMLVPFEQFFVPPTPKAIYEIWLQLTQWFLRGSCLKLLKDDDKADEGGRRSLPIHKAPPLHLG